MLSSPIILADFPAIAPESPADLCDSTEIDELLLLRIMTLTDEEKREARSTDERARRIIDGADSIPREVFERLHGAIRQPQKTDGWVDTDGGRLARGAQVRLVPKRRADSTDFFLKQRKATVAGVYRDLEDRCYVAVTVDDDPAAALHNETGRYFYFDPDEVELIAHEERI
jgi:hypothetical protein